MAFSVVVTAQARADIDTYTVFIAQDSPAEAARWKDGLEALILSLVEMPARFDVIPEAGELRRPYRSALHHSHRVIYRIDVSSNTVFVVRVVHGARKKLAPHEV